MSELKELLRILGAKRVKVVYHPTEELPKEYREEASTEFLKEEKLLELPIKYELETIIIGREAVVIHPKEKAVIDYEGALTEDQKERIRRYGYEVIT